MIKKPKLRLTFNTIGYSRNYWLYNDFLFLMFINITNNHLIISAGIIPEKLIIEQLFKQSKTGQRLIKSFMKKYNIENKL